MRWLFMLALAACARPIAPCTSDSSPHSVASWCRAPREGAFERRLANGQLVERGTYVDGQLHETYASWYAHGGPHTSGRYVRGLREGSWRMWHENGQLWIEATYADGVPHGRWIEREYNGTVVFDGTYVRGRLHGAWKVWRVDGSLRGAGESVAGKLDGRVIAYRPDGARVEQAWRENRLHGRLLVYDASGAVTHTSEYRDGIEVKDADRSP